MMAEVYCHINNVITSNCLINGKPVCSYVLHLNKKWKTTNKLFAIYFPVRQFCDRVPDLVKKEFIFYWFKE